MEMVPSFRVMHVLFFSMVFPTLSDALNNGVARTPPMGWLEWERFRCNIDCTSYPSTCVSEELFLQQAEHLVALGLKDAGYIQINIDDCWSAHERDSSGRLQADPKRFPHGIKYLADEIHKKGLKLGIYGDFGTKTCAGYPGSLGYLDIDAQTFADWTVDMLKLDGCNVNISLMKEGYPQMAKALNKTGRPIVFSCSWPDYERSAGEKPDYQLIANNCNLWRNYRDISDSWDSVVSIIKYYGDNQNAFQPYAGPGNWNDPDMLIVGDYGLSLDQSKAQFAIWSIFAAPLLMSVDLRNISQEFVDILSNKEIIAVDQDELGIMGRRVLEVIFEYDCL
jgi:alpha-N-acetylgalactosaminidase